MSKTFKNGFSPVYLCRLESFIIINKSITEEIVQDCAMSNFTPVLRN